MYGVLTLVSGTAELGCSLFSKYSNMYSSYVTALLQQRHDFANSPQSVDNFPIAADPDFVIGNRLTENTWFAYPAQTSRTCK
jgi:hypothetical protein